MPEWKDAFGQVIKTGDIVEDTNRKIIGRVIKRYGMPMIYAMKKFNAELLSYEMVELKGPNAAYEYGIIPRHTKIWYRLHGYVLDHIEIIKPMREGRNVY